ncbi:MAG: lamin tail domain-containing protein, partial [Bacteroidota bacterium]
MKNLFFTLFLTVLYFNSFSQNIVISEIMYNNPGVDDYEYVELYNNGSTTVNLGGWAFTKGITYTFPSVSMAPGDFLVVAKDSAIFEAAFGVAAFQWGANGGALNNSGETILLVNSSSGFVDSVAYAAASPWPGAANGLGASLVLCDFGSNNNLPGNWAAAITPTNVILSGIQVLANPGGDSACPGGPVLGFLTFQNGYEFSPLENAGTVNVFVILANGNANPTQVTVSASAASTATPGSDHSFTAPQTVIFPAGVLLDTQIVSFNIVDDGDLEGMETIVLELSNPTNSGTVAPSAGQFTFNVIDNDAPLTNALVITGVFDTQVQSTGTWAKGVELQAIQDIPNLGIFGIGSANNGGGSAGVEVMMPFIAVDSGDCVYVTNDSALFHQFFGIPPTVVGDAANINGDDAIELFENSLPIDVFGDINVDGTGQPWEYLDGWAYRLSGTGPDGTVFQLASWKFSGIDAFDNVPNNASAPTPFPTCAYSVVASDHAVANDDNAFTEFNTALTINILGNDDLPLPLVSILITSPPAHGTAIVNGLTNISYTPNAGYCGSDAFTYQICDAVGCDNATVN